MVIDCDDIQPAIVPPRGGLPDPTDPASLRCMTFRHAALAVACVIVLLTTLAPAQTTAPAVSKLKDVVVYRDDTFYSAFPSIVRRPDGELIVAFRRAPDPRNFGKAGYTHTDPSSQLVLVRSRDAGDTWS